MLLVHLFEPARVAQVHDVRRKEVNEYGRERARMHNGGGAILSGQRAVFSLKELRNYGGHSYLLTFW